jgi:hypothetical protein
MNLRWFSGLKEAWINYTSGQSEGSSGMLEGVQDVLEGEQVV